jgi:hypothetical protein
MKQKPTSRTSKGRADVLFAGLIEQALRYVPNPVVRAIAQEAHEKLKPSIASDLKRIVGPRTRQGRIIGEFAESAKNVARRIQEGAK